MNLRKALPTSVAALIGITAAATDAPTSDHATADRVIIINAARGFTSVPETIAAPGSRSIAIPDGHPDINIEITAQSIAPGTSLFSRHVKNLPPWGLTLSDTAGQRYEITISATETDDLGLGTSPAIEARVSAPHNRQDLRVKAPGNRAPAGNPERIRIAKKNGRWSLTFASGKSTRLPELPLPADFSPDSIAIATQAPLKLRSLTVRRRPHPDLLTTQWADTARLQRHLKRSTDPLEGFWNMYDFTLEHSLIRTGGDYRLAIVRDGDGYIAVYLGGARTEASEWKPGMIKAWLRPTPYADIYTITWLDASRRPMSHQLKAVSSNQNTILTIDLPYQQSVFRLRRLPARCPDSLSGMKQKDDAISQ